MVYSPIWGSRYLTILFKYACQTARTLKILFSERPRTVFVMTPPVIACLPVWIYAKWAKAQYMIDAHTAAFVTPPWNKLLFLHGFFSRGAKVTTVTNSYLQSFVHRWRAKSLILSDVPVYLAGPAPRCERVEPHFRMTFVSSFTPDEPLGNFLLAAAKLPQFQFFITGNYKDADRNLVLSKSDNVHFTGYLSDAAYVELLRSSDAVISLTTEDHTMQRGAYEAVYLGRPVITSGFGILREAFPRGTVHVDNTPDAIVGGILRMQENLTQYVSEVEDLKNEKLERWKKLESEIGELLRADDVGGNDVVADRVIS